MPAIIPQRVGPNRQPPRQGLAGVTRLPTTPGPFVLPVKDDVLGGPIAVVGDILRIKAFNGTTVLDNWLQVTGRDTSPTGYTNFTVERRSGTPGTFPAGAAVVNYEQAGSGWIVQTADDANGPFISLRTHQGAPWATQTELVRLGNLNGWGAYVAPTYGLVAGQYNAAGQSWLTVEPTNGFRLGSGTQTRLSMDTTNGLVLRDSTGAIQLQLDMSGNAVFSGALSAATGTFAGSLSAATGSFSGTITAAAGTIGNWTIDATSLSSSVMDFDNAAGISVVPSSVGSSSRAYKFQKAGGGQVTGYWWMGIESGGINSSQFLIDASYGAFDAISTIQTNAGGTHRSSLQLIATRAGQVDVSIDLENQSPANTLTLTAPTITLGGNAIVTGGLNLGTGSAAGVGNIFAAGSGAGFRITRTSAGYLEGLDLYGYNSANAWRLLVDDTTGSGGLGTNAFQLWFGAGAITRWDTSGNMDLVGNLKRSGTQVLGPRVTGYTNAWVTTAAERALALNAATVTLVQLAQRVRALQDDLTTHGVIGA